MPMLSRKPMASAEAGEEPGFDPSAVPGAGDGDSDDAGDDDGYPDEHDVGLGDDEYDYRPDGLDDWAWEAARECADLDQNDRHNGFRLIIWFGADLVYVTGMGWLTFRGTHWQ